MSRFFFARSYKFEKWCKQNERQNLERFRQWMTEFYSSLRSVAYVLEFGWDATKWLSETFHISHVANRNLYSTLSLSFTLSLYTWNFFRQRDEMNFLFDFITVFTLTSIGACLACCKWNTCTCVQWLTTKNLFPFSFRFTFQTYNFPHRLLCFVHFQIMFIVCTLHTQQMIFFFIHSFRHRRRGRLRRRKRKQWWMELNKKPKEGKKHTKEKGDGEKSHWFTISPHCHYCHTHTHTHRRNYVRYLFAYFRLSHFYVWVCSVFSVHCSTFECALRRHVNTIMCRQSMRHVLDVRSGTLWSAASCYCGVWGYNGNNKIAWLT